MKTDCRIISETYQDSVKLMRVANSAIEEYELDDATAFMGTEANKERLQAVEAVSGDTLESISETDLVLTASGDTTEQVDEALDAMADLIRSAESTAPSGSTDSVRPKTIERATDQSDIGVAFISVPGEYAVQEAWKALQQGHHVHLFSDNVDIDQERELKMAARDRGVLLMGPDCGSAILDGVPLGFANEVRNGKIGVVSASGTGLQEVTSLVHQAGAGISQAIGTGGRDLSDDIGGVMTRAALEELDTDEETDVIVLLSKPPGDETLGTVLEAVDACSTPVVIDFLGRDPDELETTSSEVVKTLADAAESALSYVDNSTATADNSTEGTEAFEAHLEEQFPDGFGTRTDVRGLFTGGTLCTEAVDILGDHLDGVSANVSLGAQLAEPLTPTGHAFVDLGADELTVGRPHPMIDPAFRSKQIRKAAADEDVAVILLDIVLGHGAHEDPAGGIATALQDCSNPPLVIGSVCGTADDPQSRQQQVETLESAGVWVAPNNATAAELARHAIAVCGSTEVSQ